MDVDFDLKNSDLAEITNEFMVACKELKDSELIEDACFKLSDAMSAIEIMDAKMDTGMIRIERKLDNFSPEVLSKSKLSDIIAMFDATFALLTSWINAQPMDQTVFTNMCFFKPASLEDSAPHLYTMTISLLYAINLFRIIINIASVANDEDICIMSGRDNLPKHELIPDYVQRHLTRSIASINTQLKDKRKSSDFPRLEALKMRFELFLTFFDLFKYLLPPPKSLQQQNNVTERFIPDFKKSGAAAFTCIQLTRKLLTTIHLGSQPPEDDVDGDFSWLPIFDPNAYIYLSPPGFPRKPKLHTRENSYAYFEDLLEIISKMIRGAFDSTGSTDEIIEFLRQFGDVKSSILTRSILQLIMMPNDHMICGTVSLADIILASMNRANGLLNGNGVEEKLRMLLAVDSPIKESFDDFIMNLLIRGYIGVFQTFGHNLARQRERMLKTNFDDFGMLMMEANRMEAELEVARLKIADDSNSPALLIPSVQNIFSNYLLHNTLQLMRYHFSLGFYLRLFQPYEFIYVYWYFGDIIARSLCNFCDRIYNSMIMEFSKSAIHQQKKVSGKKLQQKTKSDNEFRKNLSRVKKRYVLHRVEMIMSHAIFKFTAGLISAKQLRLPKKESLRYAKRIEPFQNVPDMLFYTYDEYRRESKIEELLRHPFEEIFKEAATYFDQALTVINDVELDGTTEESEFAAILLAIQRVAKKNMICAKLLATQKMDKKISFEFSSEGQLNFPIIRFI